MDNECPICCKPYTNVLRRPVICLCGFKVCKICARTYVKENVEHPHCMDPTCKVKWDDEFLVKNLDKCFMDGEYKYARKEILFQKEQSKFPNTMEKVPTYIKLNKLKNVYKIERNKYNEYYYDLFNKRNEIDNIINMLTNKVQFIKCHQSWIMKRDNIQSCGKIYDTNNDHRCSCGGTIRRKYIYRKIYSSANDTQEEKITYMLSTNIPKYISDNLSIEENIIIRNQLDELYNLRAIEHKRCNKILKEYPITHKVIKNEINMLKHKLNNTNNDITKRKFIHPCPIDKCNGFLSNKWKCGVCAIKVCKDCLIPLKDNSKEHVCSQDDINTAELIKNTTKPCPKCGERITKITGCDQMWCITCKTPFSWNTGKIVNGVIHNPHFYAWQKSMDNTMVRAPGDIVCGGLPTFRFYNKKLNKLGKGKWYELCIEIYRIANELQDKLDELRIYNNINNQDNELLRIKYLINDINKNRLMNSLYRIDKTNNYKNDLLNLYEITVTVIVESINSIDNITTIYNIATQLNRINDICIYFNTQIQHINNTYKKRNSYTLNTNWNSHSIVNNDKKCGIV